MRYGPTRELTIGDYFHTQVSTTKYDIATSYIKNDRYYSKRDYELFS